MSNGAKPDWRLGVDIGGTFTDVVLWQAGSSTLVVEKLLTTPENPARGVVAGIDAALQAAGLKANALSSIVHGTTLVANALIERKGVRTALVTTKGFRDVLEIGREWRYDQFDLNLKLPELLVPRPRRLELDERIDARGNVLTAPTAEAIQKTIAALRETEVESVAICLLHAYLNPGHERAFGEALARAMPDVSVSLSSQVSPEMGEYERTSTAAANAYVHPVFRAYVEHLIDSLQARGYDRDLLMVLSDGRSIRAQDATAFPIRLVQSGPAAGAEAARLFGELSGYPDTLCFDMGGTTAKACFIPGGQPERTVRFEVARETRFAEGSGLPLQIPAIDMIEIGAGGGSIARLDQRGLIQVGPDSAGSLPGPACYGKGNARPTVTDCDLVLGYLDAENFLGGTMQLDRAAAEKAISENLAVPLGVGVEAAAWGVHETVTANMAQAATIHAIEKALDPTRFALLPIGGAGPVHACSMARKMGIQTLVCPVGAGVASAVGMLGSAVSFEVARAAPARLSELDFSSLVALVEDMVDEASRLVQSAGVSPCQTGRQLSAMMRYVGQGYEIEVPLDEALLGQGDRTAIESAFTRTYRHRYGRHEIIEPEVLSWRLVVNGPRPPLAQALATRSPAYEAASPKALRERPVWFQDDFVATPVFARASLAAGMTLSGPAIVEEGESTLVLPPESHLLVDPALNLVVTV